MERVKNAQQSTDALISMQNEVTKLESEIVRLQGLLATTNTTQITFELYKESLEAEKAKVNILRYLDMTLSRNAKS